MRTLREIVRLGICLTILGLGPSVPAAAQEAGRLTGRLFNDTASLRGVTVVLTRAGGAVQTTISKDDGTFQFDDVPAGRYSLDFLLGEHIAHADNVDVRAGAITQLEQQ